MTGLSLPALDGRSPLGFLAALGVLRLVVEHTGHPARLAFSRQDCTAVLHNAHPDIDTLVEDLAAVVASIPDGGVLSQVAVDFPPPGTSPDKLRLTRKEFTAYARQVTAADGLAAERWLGVLVTDLSTDDKGRIDISPYAAPSGQQSTRTMLTKPLIEVRKNPIPLREALVAWRRYPGISGEYLDHRVLFNKADAADGKSAERGVPGATWLALMAYPLLRTTAAGGEPMSTCWQDLGDRAGRRMVYPLWSSPLDIPAVQAVLSHPVLAGVSTGAAPAAATLLSIFWIGHAARRRIPKRDFAGVLVPVNNPTRPLAPVRRGRGRAAAR
ncbi:MAG TPA: hypothetical protein VFM55_20275 [Micromonosporaceae bacterium]|nr:hypothetical protein [Micromonosporaceae bacterium]